MPDSKTTQTIDKYFVVSRTNTGLVNGVGSLVVSRAGLCQSRLLFSFFSCFAPLLVIYSVVFALIFEKDDGIDEGDKGVICFVEFIVTRKDTTELFYFSEVTFYYISTLVQLFTVTPRLLAMGRVLEQMKTRLGGKRCFQFRRCLAVLEASVEYA